MNGLTFLKRLILTALLFFLTAGSSYAQFAFAKPQNILRPTGLNRVIINLAGDIPQVDIPDNSYSWTVFPSMGVSIVHTDHTNASATATFSSAATGVYIFTLTRGNSSASVSVTAGNIAAATNTGLEISVFNVFNGSIAPATAPAFLFDPFPDALTTAALGVTLNGYYYYMPNVLNNGSVTLYAASPDGLTTAAVASLDLNGSSNNSLGFVRLAIDATRKGWILAGDGATLYLANFTTNGLNGTTINLIDDNVTVIGSDASIFQNGDLCFSGSGTIFALANNGSGVTQIFAGTPNGASTALTKKWDLTDPAGNAFTGNVNGVAFDISGSLYISTGGTTGGLYFIDQNTVNSATGTVQCSLVWSGQGLTDLASNFFPAQTTLPLKLTTFSGYYHNQQTILRWQSEGEHNFSHFEIERSPDGNNYLLLAIKPSAGTGKQVYQFTDDLSGVSGNSFTYRLKMVDADGKFQYSNIILVKRDLNAVTGISVNPNPLINGMATLRFSAAEPGSVSIIILDLSGKIVWHQNHEVAAGSNSIALNDLDRLTKGIYILQLANGCNAESVKFTFTR